MVSLHLPDKFQLKILILPQSEGVHEVSHIVLKVL
jgi:hypothetical protein